jgi:hypothetical protein
MFHVNRLHVQEGPAVHHIIATHLADEDRYLLVGGDNLLGLRAARAWIDDEGAIEATRHLAQAVVVAVIPVRAGVRVRDGECRRCSSCRNDGVLTHTWDAVGLQGNLQAVEVDRGRLGELVVDRHTHVIARGHAE